MAKFTFTHKVDHMVFNIENHTINDSVEDTIKHQTNELLKCILDYSLKLQTRVSLIRKFNQLKGFDTMEGTDKEILDNFLVGYTE